MSLQTTSGSIAALAVLLPLAGCGVVEPDDIHDALEENRTLWAGQNIHSYRYEFLGGCFCSPEYTQWVTVTVENGRVVEVTPLEGGVPIVDTPLEAWSTVEGLFEIVENAADDEGLDWDIDVEYHPTLGYPTSIDLSTSEPIADAGAHHEATNLVALQP